MKTPSLEEVKQKYLNAKEVRCLFDDEIYNISKMNNYFDNEDGSFWCEKTSRLQCELYDNGIYAEIISYKEKTYQLSETFVKELCKEPNIKEAFIREGIIENDKLEVGKWYNWINKELLFFITKIENDQIYYYGFDYGVFENDWIHIDNDFELATPQEVETALINEAKKRGYENLKHNCLVASNLKINNPCKEYIYRKNKLWIGTEENANCIFHNGVWAEIIDETIEIKKSVILNTPNDLELGQLIRNFKK